MSVRRQVWKCNRRDYLALIKKRRLTQTSNKYFFFLAASPYGITDPLSGPKDHTEVGLKCPPILSKDFMIWNVCMIISSLSPEYGH